MNSGFYSPLKSSNKSFTLVELVIVIIIVGILASIGLTQYEAVVERSRTAEAKIQFALMRDYVVSYYLEHGTVAGMQNEDVGVDDTCVPTHYYRYGISSLYCEDPAVPISLHAQRCKSDGKTPNARSPDEYLLTLEYWVATGAVHMHCQYNQGGREGQGCVGMPSP